MRKEIIKGITIIAIILFMVSVACIDSNSNLPTVGCIISGGWLALIVIANN